MSHLFILIKKMKKSMEFFSGNGKAIIDGEEISLSTGDWLKSHLLQSVSFLHPIFLELLISAFR